MSIKEEISRLLVDPTAKHKRLTEYCVGQLKQGRSLSEIVADPYVTNRLNPMQRCALVEEPEIGRASCRERVCQYV